MPYLTLLDKISQNLALLKGNSHKIFKISQIFRPSRNTFYKEISINHILVFITSFLTLRKRFLVTVGEFQGSFCENLTEFYQISLKMLVYLTDLSLWHV